MQLIIFPRPGLMIELLGLIGIQDTRREEKLEEELEVSREGRISEPKKMLKDPGRGRLTKTGKRKETIAEKGQKEEKNTIEETEEIEEIEEIEVIVDKGEIVVKKEVREIDITVDNGETIDNIVTEETTIDNKETTVINANNVNNALHITATNPNRHKRSSRM